MIYFAVRCLPRISERVDQLITDAILGWVSSTIKLSLELRTLRNTFIQVSVVFPSGRLRFR